MKFLNKIIKYFSSHTSAFLVALCLLLGSSSAFAQAGHLVWPEFGAGIGAFNNGGVQETALQFDFSVGFEQEGFPWSPGFLLRLDLDLFSNDGQIFDEARFDVAPLVTLSSTYESTFPFFRAGAGPLLTVSDRGGFGIGAHGELAVGFKSILDLFVDAKASVDGFGPSIGIIAGIRLNAFLFDRAYRVYVY